MVGQLMCQSIWHHKYLRKRIFMNKTYAELMRELMDQLKEGYYGWDDDRYDDEEEESDEARAEREHNERLERRRESYGDSDESDFDYDRNYKLNELPRYQEMCGSGEFYFEERNVISLEGAPEKVKDFVCENNKLQSLAHCPKTVTGMFNCSDNKITTLEGGPQGSVWTYVSKGNPLVNLHGCPEHIGNYFEIESSRLTSYEGAPKAIDGWCAIPLISADLRELVKHFPKLGRKLKLKLDRNKMALTNVLSLFNTGVQTVEAYTMGGMPPEVKHGFEIVNKYLPDGRKGMMRCQAELMKAGLGPWAKI
jgi:hypothetical protein